MNAQEVIASLSDQNVRKKFFENNFPMWYAWHFGWEFPDFHKDWLEDLVSGKDILWEAFRGSRKTSMVRGYVIWCICYKKEPFIIWQSFEDVLSAESVREIAKMLLQKSIFADYGMLFPLQTQAEDLAKKSVSNFESTNGVKVASKSMGQTLRGANTYGKDGLTRPTLLILDDIDVERSVKNIEIIDDNERKILSETIGSLDPLRRRIIFLGNTITTDGVVPRFHKRYKHSKNWIVRKQPLFVDGKNIWEDVFTPLVVEKLKEDGETAFNANYLLIPYAHGDTIISKSSIRHADSYPEGASIYFGIDPAFSLKTNSDPMALTITARKDKQRFIIKSLEFTGQEKNEERFCNTVEDLYKKYGCVNINIESNNGGEIIGRMLKARNLATNILSATKDKITRLREFQGDFERGEIFFLPGTEKLENQLLLFPNDTHDDLVDSMVYSLMKGNEFWMGTF